MPGRRLGAALRLAVLMVMGAMALGACGAGDSTTTTTTTTTTVVALAPGPEPTPSTGTTTTTEPAAGLGSVSGPFAPGRTQLPGFGEVEVRIVDGPDGEPVVLCVMLAETDEQRRRGLMEVTDAELGGYDGMLFAYDDDVTGGFWMKDTRIPLSIAYLDRRGAVVESLDMEPCPEAVEAGEGCPSHPPSGPYRRALEVPQGRLAPLGLVRGGARVEVAGPCRPATG